MRPPPSSPPSVRPFSPVQWRQRWARPLSIPARATHEGVSGLYFNFSVHPPRGDFLGGKPGVSCPVCHQFSEPQTSLQSTANPALGQVSGREKELECRGVCLVFACVHMCKSTTAFFGVRVASPGCLLGSYSWFCAQGLLTGPHAGLNQFLPRSRQAPDLLCSSHSPVLIQYRSADSSVWSSWICGRC